MWYGILNGILNNATSFPGSFPWLGGGRERKDPGNEVGVVWYNA